MSQKCINCKYFIKANKNNIFPSLNFCEATRHTFYLYGNLFTRFNRCYLYEEKENEANNNN